MLAGPTCTQILAGLGSDVIKIERPGVGDDTRSWGPPFLSPNATLSQSSTAHTVVSSPTQSTQSTYFLAANSGKRSVALDYSHAAGRSALLELVRCCDVIVDNFRPGTLAKYGLDIPTLRKYNPNIVTASLTAFGSGNPSGPRTPDAGYDVSIGALGGLLHITGEGMYPVCRCGLLLC